MIDTVKFDIPLSLNLGELNKINWTSITERQSNGSVKCFYTLKEKEFVGEPFIFYTLVKDEPDKNWLRVEVSLPKFRYGTNFYELNDVEMNWTLEMLKVFLCKKLKISLHRLPNTDSWTIKKLHICKNFDVGLNLLDYLSNASKKVLPRRKITAYKASGKDQIQTVVWKSKSATEKLYNKHDEIKENKNNHDDSETLISKSKGCIRYESELSPADLRTLHSKYSTSQILSSAVIKPLLNTNIKRLNLNFNIESTELKKLLSIIERDSDLSTRSKNSLIAFITKTYEFGESYTKSSYSPAGYYKIKPKYDEFLLKNVASITQKLKPLTVADFDFVKYK